MVSSYSGATAPLGSGTSTAPGLSLFYQGNDATYAGYALIKFQQPSDSVHSKWFSWTAGTQASVQTGGGPGLMAEGEAPTPQLPAGFMPQSFYNSGSGALVANQLPLKGVQFSISGGVGFIKTGTFTLYGIVKPT
jgi:hypothetical protein